MHIRPARIDEAAQLSRLINDLVPQLSLSEDRTGIEIFLASISASAIEGYIRAENFCYQVGESAGQLVGVVAIRDNSHLYHLFVAREFQDQGLARTLWQSAREAAIQRGNSGRFTVNASLNAAPVYQRFGFVATEPAQTLHGVTFQPMLLSENGA